MTQAADPPSTAAPDPTRAPDAEASLDAFLDRYAAVLRRVFREAPDGAAVHLRRGLPAADLRALLATKPLSVFIPRRHGGRAGPAAEGGDGVAGGLAMLERSAYESLAMALTMGINGALFLQPVAKYAREGVQNEVFPRFLAHQNMGGLMITEPDYGSDALSMETAWTEEGDGYRIRGTKHWAGLTGLADLWLMTARKRGDDGRLARDVDFFVLDAHDPAQSLVVEERFHALGLYPIPYGRNGVDVHVPAAHRLEPTRNGLTMMLDLLHRSRLQFPGMALGFLHRLADEALQHVRTRAVGGKSLLHYDQVRRRLADLQASVTLADAMNLHAAEHADPDADLAKDGLRANVVKTVVTDKMQGAAQSLLQLVGAAGYKLDHVAGRGLIDSRPFQIFEGSNDILYEQIAGTTLKAMKAANEVRLDAFLRGHALTARAAERLGDLLHVRIDGDVPQRRRVDLGRIVGRVAGLDMTLELAERGYDAGRVEVAVQALRTEIAVLLGALHQGHDADPSDAPASLGAWRAVLRTG